MRSHVPSESGCCRHPSCEGVAYPWWPGHEYSGPSDKPLASQPCDPDEALDHPHDPCRRRCCSRGAGVLRCLRLGAAGGGSAPCGGLGRRRWRSRRAVASRAGGCRVGLRAGGGDGRANAAYRAAAEDTDAAAVAFRQHSGGVSVSPDVRLVLARIGDGLEDLSALRRQVQDDPRALSSVILFRYRALIADLLTFRASLSQIGVPAATGNGLRAAAALSQAIEAQGLLQVAVIRALAGGVLTPAMQQEIVGASSMFGESLTDFQLSAPAVWRARLNTDVTGPVVAGAERDQGVVTRTPPGERVKLAVDAAGWSAAMTARRDLMHAVEVAIDRQILAEVAAQRDAARRSAALIAVLVLAVLALTAGGATARIASALAAGDHRSG
ncbi:nitrate- and nitrite sensing domain-containing protein [Dactylosporangium sucinum]